VKTATSVGELKCEFINTFVVQYIDEFLQIS